MKLKFLIIGDVVGVTGRTMLQKYLPRLRDQYRADAVIVNGENAADGRGVTPKIMDFFKGIGVTIVTSGNHIWDKKDIFPYLASNKDLLRPANFPPQCPGVGVAIIQVSGISVAVINLQGRVFMKEHTDCPFRAVDSLLNFVKDKAKVVIIDFHAETTAEKAAFGFYVDGRASVMVGTHTHVQTADERILPGGTGFITDLGMCGALNSSLGMKKDAIINLFLTQMPQRFNVETSGPVLLNGVFVEIDSATGSTTMIERIRIIDEHLPVEEGARE